MFYLILILVVVIVLLQGALTTTKWPIRPSFSLRNFNFQKKHIVRIYQILDEYTAGYSIQSEELVFFETFFNTFFSRTSEQLRLELFNLFLSFHWVCFNSLVFVLDFYKNILNFLLIMKRIIVRSIRTFIYVFILSEFIDAFAAFRETIPFIDYFDEVPLAEDVIESSFLLISYLGELMRKRISFLWLVQRRRTSTYYRTAICKFYSKSFDVYETITAGQYDFFYWFDLCFWIENLDFRFNKKFFRNTFVFTSFNYYRSITHSHLLEIFWTLLPSLILIVIAVPSVFVLYILDEPTGYVLNVFKVIGHQWQWSYEIADCTLNLFDLPSTAQVIFDSFMIPTSEITPGQLRLLEVDNSLFIPVETPLVFIVTSDDVLHSWALPSLGIKIDAVPGRLNQVQCFVTRVGEFYGQCSELCGIHHGFMPIHVIAV